MRKEKGMKILNKRFIKSIMLLITFPLCFISCNEEFPNMLKEDYGKSGVVKNDSKVLLIVVDGIRGAVLTDVDPVNLRLFSRNSLYSYSAFGDNEVATYTKEVGLANIMTGVKSDLHGVNTNSLADMDLVKAPTLITRIKENKEGFKSEAYSSDEEVTKTLFEAADIKEKLEDDKAVVQKVVSSIKTSQSDMVIAHLNNPYKVGQSKSYESTDENYKNAIIDFDQQVKEMIDALSSRESYKNEDWLVILTSSIGGEIKADQTNNDKTAFGDSKQNLFTYFYSPKFSSKFIIKPNTSSIPFQGTAFRMNTMEDQWNAGSARLLDDTKLNIGPNDNVTITFFYKQTNLNWWFWWTPIVQKWRSWGSISVSGYIIYMAWDGRLGMNWFRGTEIVTEPINDGPVWHAITVVIDRKDDKARMFTDGRLTSEANIGKVNLTNIEPFVIGRSISHDRNEGDVLICNFQYYNIAMTNDEVKEYAKLSVITEENMPHYDNLIAYWPFYDDEGKREVKDVTGRTGNLTLFNNVRWHTFSDPAGYILPEFNSDTYRIVPNTVDIPLAIYQWLGVIPNTAWGLKSKVWTFPYKVFEY